MNKFELIIDIHLYINCFYMEDIMSNYYENWKETEEAREKLALWVRDPECLLSGNGEVEGVYEISFVNEKTNANISAYIGQCGFDAAAPNAASNVYERLLQHLKRWLGGDYFTYWSGLQESDADWKIVLHLLQEDTDHRTRLALESKFIENRRPFLQDSKNGKFSLYPKNGYNRNDLCITPWNGQHRAAFLERVAELQKG